MTIGQHFTGSQAYDKFILGGVAGALRNLTVKENQLLPRAGGMGGLGVDG